MRLHGAHLLLPLHHAIMAPMAYFDVLIMNMIKWPMFGYNLLAWPTRAKASIWRRLKKLGAVNVNNLVVLGIF